MTSAGVRLHAFSVALAGLAFATVLPWARSGSRSRNSYSLFAIAERLGVVTGTAATAARWWALVPGATLAAVALLQLGYRRVGTAVGALVALLSLLAVNAVAGSPLAGEIGLTSCATAAVAVLIFALVELVHTFRRHTPLPTPGVHHV